MLARTLLAAATIALGMIAAPMSAQAADTAAYDRLLTRYVVASPDGINRVRYTAWAANAGDIDALNAYVASLEQDRPSRMTRDERLAHWINLYNAVTLQIILENYPVRSIRDIRSQTLDPRGLIGPWRTQRVTVEGRRLTLDQIENSILRPEFNEPRIHYAINCASNGCPSLQPAVWTGTDLTSQLESAASSFINSPRGSRIDDSGRPSVSRIFKWYERDFDREGGVTTHLLSVATADIKLQLATSTAPVQHHYDWHLNDADPDPI